jgi:hypothetical protein
MPVESRQRRLGGLQATITARNPGDWIDDQLRDITRNREQNGR